MTIAKPLWFGRHKALVRLLEAADAEGRNEVMLDRKWAGRLADEFGETLIRVEQLERLLRGTYGVDHTGTIVPPDVGIDPQILDEIQNLLFPDLDMGTEDDPLALRNQYRETNS